MINLPTQYSNTALADEALNFAAAQNQNTAAALSRNTPVEPQTPNRVSSPEQIASALKSQQGASGVATAGSMGYLLDVRA
ncbi:MAG: hypothetical protein ACP5Q0_01275 [Halothiobacillus sp.]